MRVTSAIWVAALVRRYNGQGMSAALVRRGADEAGAIFIVVDRLDGTSDFYAPAPQTAFDEARPSERRFQRILEAVQADVIAEKLARESRFDPDIWVVGVEDRQGTALFDHD